MREADFDQIERNIAQCRVILSVAAPFAIYLDPTEPTLLLPLTGGIFLIDPYALAVLVVHLAYSLTIYLVATRALVTPRIALVTMIADVLFAAAVALVTEGTNSPFYIFFLFAVLAAGLRGTFRTALVMTTTSLALYLMLILVSRPEGIGFHVTRCVYLAISGYLVAALGRQRRLLESGFHGLARSLHDGYAQALAGVNLRVETCRELLQRGDSAEAFTELTELQAAVTHEYDELRAYVRSLLGLDTTPAPPTSKETHFSVRARFDASLPVLEHALQIMAEGARNVSRHAGAGAAVITAIPTGNKVVIRIDDDGVGFASAAEPPWSIASRAAALGGDVRVRRDGQAGGHLIVELPRG